MGRRRSLITLEALLFYSPPLPPLPSRRRRGCRPRGAKRDRTPIPVPPWDILSLLASMQEVRRFKRSTDRPAVLDVGTRFKDIERITRSIPLFKACIRAGLDGDDIIQIVSTSIFNRQANYTPYDPARGGIGKYVHQVARTVMLNLLRAAKTHPEPTGATLHGEQVDAALVAIAEPVGRDVGDVLDEVVEYVVDQLGADAGTEARALLDGRTHRTRCARDVVEAVREALTTLS